MTLYDVNKQAYAQLPDLTHVELVPICNSFVEHVNKRFAETRFMMMLCHDTRDYTLFHMPSKAKASEMLNEIFGIFKKRGYSLKGIETRNDDNVEFWVQDNKSKECYMYLLFDYNWGVITL